MTTKGSGKNKAVSPVRGSDISGPEFAKVRDALKQYTRHVVCLCFFVYRRDLGKDLKKETRANFCSGFIMEIGGKWYWTTAGHILEDIDGMMKDQDLAVEGFRFLDHFGAGATDRHAIPFHYEGAWRSFEYDSQSGLDYGVVEIGEHEKRLLQANKVLAVKEEEWLDLDKLAFKSHFMIGFPSDYIERSAIPIPDGAIIQGRTTPSFIYVEKVDNIPEEERQRPFPRMVGSLSPNWPDGEIDGMSGGPVIGFLQGEAAYRIVAIQSKWLRLQRMTFACPLKTAGQRIVKAIREQSSPEKTTWE